MEDSSSTNNLQMENQESVPSNDDPSSRRTIILIVIIALLLLAGIIAGVYFLVGHPAQTETIRDIFIIFLALEFLLIGAALVVLIVQIARLTTLLENEIKPILDSTTEAVNTLKGTSAFLSNQLVNPVVKTYSSFSAIRRVFDIFKPSNRRTTEKE